MTDFTEVIYSGCTYSTKAGWGVRFMLNSDDAAKALDAAGAGKRYQMALIPIDDMEQPIPDPPKAKRQTYSQRAALILQDERFRDLVAADFDIILHSAEEANDWLLRYCGIGRKRTLDDEQMRQERQSFLDLETAFKIWTGEISGPVDNY